MLEYKIDDRLYITSELLSYGSVVHGFTSKLGGVSSGKISGLNLGFRVDDAPESVLKNYELVANDLGLDLNNTVLARQSHTDNIRIVTKDDAGKGVVRDSDIMDTDGLITNISGIALVVFSADCVPILMLDTKQKVIAAIHAGWRGTVKGIAPKGVSLMCSNFGCHPKDICVAIGPSIGPCCFEFGSDAKEHFPTPYCSQKSNNKFMIDLWSMNRDLLISAGVLPDNIDISGLCTVCHADTFHSDRTHRENTGRQVAIISLGEENL